MTNPEKEDEYLPASARGRGRPKKREYAHYPVFYSNPVKNRAFCAYIEHPNYSNTVLAHTVGIHPERLAEWKVKDGWSEKRWVFLNERIHEIFRKMPKEDDAIVESMKLVQLAEKNIEKMLAIAGKDFQEYPTYSKQTLELLDQTLKMKKSIYHWLQNRKANDPMVGR